MGELADAIDGVVVVKGQQVMPAGEGIGLADQLERAAGVGREDAQVFLGVGVEELEHVFARAFDQFGGGQGGGVG